MPCSSAGERYRHQTPPPCVPFISCGPLIIWACYVPLSRPNASSCLCLPPFTNEPSDRRLYLPTATSPTRAPSPPSTTKTCTTTRISGTCKCFTPHLHCGPPHAQGFLCYSAEHLRAPRSTQQARKTNNVITFYLLYYSRVHEEYWMSLLMFVLLCPGAMCCPRPAVLMAPSPAVLRYASASHFIC